MRLFLLAAALMTLTHVTPAFADTATTKSSEPDPDQAIKCRRVEVTGSHVKKGKVCKTVAEWKRIIDNGNRTARAVVLEGAKPTN